MGIEGTHLDPTARSVWVDLYQIGSTVIFSTYTDEGLVERPVDITPEFVAKMMASFDALTAQGDRVTVLKEHKIDGDHYGTAHELRVDGDHLQSRTSFTPSVWEAYDDDRIVEFSPGFVPSMRNPHTGETHENVLLEVTITAMALQHTLRPPQETNANHTLIDLLMSGSLTFAKEDSMADEKTEDPAVETPVEEEDASPLDAANARIAELEASLQAMQDKYEGEEEEAASMAASLQSRIVALEDDVTRAELAASNIQADDALVAMKRTHPVQFAKCVESLSKPDKQTPIGTVGTAPVGGDSMNAASVIAEAAKDGVTYTNGLAKWCAGKYPNMLSEVIALARN